MVDGIAQAERSRALTKQHLADTLDRLEERVRDELDWKARLRRDGTRYALIGAAGMALITVAVLRARRSHKDQIDQPVPINSLGDIAAELSELRRLVKRGPKGDTRPLWQKAALRAVTAAGAAAGTAVARSWMEQHHTGADH